MTETDIKRRIMLATASPDIRLWNNPVGQGWQGRSFEIRDKQLVFGQARRVNYGLCPGSSDLIGPRSIVITPDMVGRRIAVFAAIEVKTETGRASVEQVSFCKTINSLGGMSGIARTEAEAELILSTK